MPFDPFGFDIPSQTEQKLRYLRQVAQQQRLLKSVRQDRRWQDLAAHQLLRLALRLSPGTFASSTRRLLKES